MSKNNAEIIKALVETTLKLKDNGTYYYSENRTQTFNKNDLEQFIAEVEALILSDVLQTCYEVQLHYMELDKNDPPELRTTSEVVLKSLIKKLKGKVRKKSKTL
jgi:hypothetical protein